MLKYEYINKEWIVAPTAQRVYRASAYLSIAFFLGWGIVLVEGVPAFLAPPAKLVLLAGVLGAGITLVGMEYFLFRFDDSNPLRQVAWFCVMIFPLLGPALYCLVVYSRSDVVKGSRTKRAEGAPLL
ncbi:MAG: hypothetical protein WA628_13025 [Terriglobales bacterium]